MRLYRLHKPLHLSYVEPSWLDEGCHVMVPKRMLVHSLTITADPVQRDTAILRAASKLGVQPAFFEPYKGEENLLIVKSPSFGNFVTRREDVDSIFRNPCPGGNTYQPIYFDARKSHGWLIWAKNTKLFNSGGFVKVSHEPLEFLCKPQVVDLLCYEAGEVFLREEDYIQAKVLELNVDVYKRIPYVQRIIKAFRVGLFMPPNWIKFNYAMAITMDFWAKQLSRKFSKKTVLRAAWEFTIHGARV